MDTTFVTLACCLLAISLAVAQTENWDFSTLPTKPPETKLPQTTTLATSSDSPVHSTAISNATDGTTPSTSTTSDKETTIHPQSTPSTTNSTPPRTNSVSPTSTTPADHMSTPGHISKPDTTVITTANSSHTINTTSNLEDRLTQGLGLNISEKNMTIVFSVSLGVFAVALVIFMFHRCKQKLQYLHQPFDNSDDPDVFAADDDTLIISGGLYDGHPIYDNVQPAPDDQSQFRLEFLQ